MLKLIGAVPVHVPVRRDNYHPDMDATRAAITDKTKAIVINSPNNPTGAVYHPSEIEELTAIAAENDLWIFDDMIYSDFVTIPMYRQQHSKAAKRVDNWWMVQDLGDDRLDLG